MKLKAMVTKFSKVSAWSAGPLKPNTSVQDDDAADVISSLAVNIQQLSTLNASEELHIIVRAHN